MKNEKLKVENVGDIKLSRRQVMQLGALGLISLVTGNGEIKAEAANNSEVLYQSFVNAFADNITGSSENNYGLTVKFNNLEQFLIADSKGNPFIYNYYKNCVAKKTRGNWSKFYADASQKKLLDQCEAYLHHLSVHPNDEAVAKNFLNYVKDNILEKKNPVPSVDSKTGEAFTAMYADFDAYYFKNVPVFETICEMVQVAWEKIPAIEKIRQISDPAYMDDTQSYNCAQVIIDKCAGRTDRSDRNGHQRHSGITKGNYQNDELINLNYYAPNKDIQTMVTRNLVTVLNEDGSRAYTDDDIRDILGLSTNGISLALKR